MDDEREVVAQVFMSSRAACAITRSRLRKFGSNVGD